MTTLKGLAGGLSQVAFFAALLLIPAGTWHWPRAIHFLAAYAVVVSASSIAMARFAPASLEARMQAPAARSQPLADRVATAFLLLALMASVVIVPIDVFRLRLLPPPPPWAAILGALVVAAGYAVLLGALFQNAFAAPIVKDQSERGQVLVDTGLYGRVRHPFYLGLLLFFGGLGLWLESYAGVAMLPLLFVCLAARIRVEEATLAEILPGYREYTERVRYRIVPLLW